MKTLCAHIVEITAKEVRSPMSFHKLNFLEHQLKIVHYLHVLFTIELTGDLSEIVSVKTSISLRTTRQSPTIHTAGDESTGEAVCIS